MGIPYKCTGGLSTLARLLVMMKKRKGAEGLQQASHGFLLKTQDEGLLRHLLSKVEDGQLLTSSPQDLTDGWCCKPGKPGTEGWRIPAKNAA